MVERDHSSSHAGPASIRGDPRRSGHFERPCCSRDDPGSSRVDPPGGGSPSRRRAECGGFELRWGPARARGKPDGDQLAASPRRGERGRLVARKRRSKPVAEQSGIDPKRVADRSAPEGEPRVVGDGARWDRTTWRLRRHGARDACRRWWRCAPERSDAAIPRRVRIAGLSFPRFDDGRRVLRRIDWRRVVEGAIASKCPRRVDCAESDVDRLRRGNSCVNQRSCCQYPTGAGRHSRRTQPECVRRRSSERRTAASVIVDFASIRILRHRHPVRVGAAALERRRKQRVGAAGSRGAAASATELESPLHRQPLDSGHVAAARVDACGGSDDRRRASFRADRIGRRVRLVGM